MSLAHLSEQTEYTDEMKLIACIVLSKVIFEKHVTVPFCLETI